MRLYFTIIFLILCKGIFSQNLLIVNEMKTESIKIDNIKQNNEIVSISIPKNANSVVG